MPREMLMSDKHERIIENNIVKIMGIYVNLI